MNNPWTLDPDRLFDPNPARRSVARSLFTEGLLDEDGSPSQRGQTIIEHTPAGRFGEPDDLGGTLIWLCSPVAAFVNGIVVPVDGGFSAFSGV